MPTPEAPRTIIDVLGTCNKLPFRLQARAEFEEVGRKPLGDAFVSVPVREFRGAPGPLFRSRTDGSWREFSYCKRTHGANHRKHCSSRSEHCDRTSSRRSTAVVRQLVLYLSFPAPSVEKVKFVARVNAHLAPRTLAARLCCGTTGHGLHRGFSFRVARGLWPIRTRAFDSWGLSGFLKG